ncbi:hypothetical protein [Fundidesulfovibrio butyratiphilus]
MDDHQSTSWRIMADYGCGLWDDQGWGTGPDNAEINAPEGYVKRFDEWLDRYAIEEEGLDLDSFNEEGRALAVELKTLVGPAVKVTYVYEKPTDATYTGPDEEEIVNP